MHLMVIRDIIVSRLLVLVVQGRCHKRCIPEQKTATQYSINDEIGIEVTITYNDGTTQTEFVSFFGIMNEEESTVDIQ